VRGVQQGAFAEYDFDFYVGWRRRRRRRRRGWDGAAEEEVDA
jgi:hypothetical protein